MSDAHKRNLAVPFFTQRDNTYIWQQISTENEKDEAGNFIKKMGDTFGPKTDPVNQGTYNFADPNKEPIEHFVKDVIPYYLWGNSPDDPTSFWERVSGTYSGSLNGE